MGPNDQVIPGQALVLDQQEVEQDLVRVDKLEQKVLDDIRVLVGGLVPIEEMGEIPLKLTYGSPIG